MMSEHPCDDLTEAKKWGVNTCGSDALRPSRGRGAAAPRAGAHMSMGAGRCGAGNRDRIRRVAGKGEGSLSSPLEGGGVRRPGRGGPASGGKSVGWAPVAGVPLPPPSPPGRGRVQSNRRRGQKKRREIGPNSREGVTPLGDFASKRGAKSSETSRGASSRGRGEVTANRRGG